MPQHQTIILMFLKVIFQGPRNGCSINDTPQYSRVSFMRLVYPQQFTGVFIKYHLLFIIILNTAFKFFCYISGPYPREIRNKHYFIRSVTFYNFRKQIAFHNSAVSRVKQDIFTAQKFLMASSHILSPPICAITSFNPDAPE